MKSVISLTTLLCVLLAVCSAQARDIEPVGYVQSERGKVVAVNESTEVQRQLEAGKVRPLYRNAALFEKDMVVTGSDSKAQLMFRDGTIMTMDENSQLRLDQFNFEFKKKENNILKFIFGPGLFRFLTGMLTEKSPEKFSLETPLGTLGIRGTDGGVEAPATDAARHAEICNAIAGLKEAPEAEQDAATGLFEQGLGLAVDQQKVFHFKGFNVMTFQDTVTRKTVQIPRGTFISVSSTEGASEPQDIGLGMRSTVPSVDTRSSPPAGLRGVLGEDGGDSAGEGPSSSGGGHSSDH